MPSFSVRSMLSSVCSPGSVKIVPPISPDASDTLHQKKSVQIECHKFHCFQNIGKGLTPLDLKLLDHLGVALGDHPVKDGTLTKSFRIIPCTLLIIDHHVHRVGSTHIRLQVLCQWQWAAAPQWPFDPSPALQLRGSQAASARQAPWDQLPRLVNTKMLVILFQKDKLPAAWKFREVTFRCRRFKFR